MFFLLAAASAAAASPPTAKVELRARASVTIVRPHLASPRTWDPATRSDQREMVKTEADGRAVRLRLTEFQ